MSFKTILGIYGERLKWNDGVTYYNKYIYTQKKIQQGKLSMGETLPCSNKIVHLSSHNDRCQSILL